MLNDKARIDELYQCLFNEDPWMRMRAADSLEKVCRIHPDWLLPYIDKISDDLAASNQASIQWHMAQIYRQVHLTPDQESFAINWLKGLLSSPEVDWIVSANSMDTLAQFAREDTVPKSELSTLLEIQCQHKSKAVVKRAKKLLNELA